MNRRNTPEDFHKRHAIDSNGCHIWYGSLTEDGYGRFTINFQAWLAHRYAYFLKYGTLDPKKEIDHKCRVRRCVNPDHLEEVTSKENVMRGNTVARRNSNKTHCKHGHEFTIENTYIKSNGGRLCKQCGRDNARKYYHVKCSST
jgi:hypothetical protein